MTARLELVRRGLALYTERLIALPNVVGVGIGARRSADPARAEPCLAVYVVRKVPLAALAEHERVPPTVQVEGAPVRTQVIETGDFERQSGGGAATGALADEPICDGLLMKAGGLDLARRIVAERLPGRWTLDPLGPDATVFELRNGHRIALATAWNHCARLRAAPEVVFAEPSLTTVGHDPDPIQAARILAPSEHRLAPEARLGGDSPRPCAESNRVWSLQLCRVPEAWALTPPEGGRAGGAGIVVGHPDTGYTRHPEIWDSAQPRLLIESGYDFEDDDAESADPLLGGFLRQPGHGTATASVIMSTILAPEVTGVAPACELLPIRVTKSVVLFGFAKLARAIHYALDRGAQVISISLGGPVRSRALDDATARAAAQGVIVVAAAGNIWPFAVFPARLPQVIGVGACNCEGTIWKKTARGSGVDLGAPGEGVWRAGIEGPPDDPVYTAGMGYGTSFAVATCAGAAALWLAFHGPERLQARYGPAGVPAVFRHLLVTTARAPDGWDSSRDGSGILDAAALLQAPLPASPPAPAEWTPESATDGPGGGAPPLAEAAAYLPDLAPAAVARAMHELSGGDWAALGDELLFHLATNPSFRDALRRRLHAPLRQESATFHLDPLDDPGWARIRRQCSTRLGAHLDRLLRDQPDG